LGALGDVVEFDELLVVGGQNMREMDAAFVKVL
jgi:hypothetical protein